MTTVEVDEKLQDLEKHHIDDFPLSDFDDPNIDKQHAIEGILEDDSPYPEVRSAVANTDDPSIPSNTLRSWTLGTYINHNIYIHHSYLSLYYKGIVWAILISVNSIFFQSIHFPSSLLHRVWTSSSSSGIQLYNSAA